MSPNIRVKVKILLTRPTPLCLEQGLSEAPIFNQLKKKRRDAPMLSGRPRV